MIADSLKVAADEEQIDRIAFFALQIRDMRVDGIELAMTAALYGYLLRSSISLLPQCAWRRLYLHCVASLDRVPCQVTLNSSSDAKERVKGSAVLTLCYRFSASTVRHRASCSIMAAVMASTMAPITTLSKGPMADIGVSKAPRVPQRRHHRCVAGEQGKDAEWTLTWDYRDQKMFFVDLEAAG